MRFYVALVSNLKHLTRSDLNYKVLVICVLQNQSARVKTKLTAEKKFRILFCV